jgi:hypothetical protein
MNGRIEVYMEKFGGLPSRSEKAEEPDIVSQIEDVAGVLEERLGNIQPVEGEVGEPSDDLRETILRIREGE